MAALKVLSLGAGVRSTVAALSGEAARPDCAEEWRSVDGWPYEVSNLGRVRRVRAACGTQIGRILSPGGKTQRYLYVTLRDRERTKCVHIHRLVAEAFLGPPPEGGQVNHINGFKHDNRADNLEYVTRTGNMAHAAMNGLLQRGEYHYGAKLRPDDVREIRRLKATGWKHAELAQRFGVSKSAICHVLSGKNWNHLKEAQL